MIGNITEGKYTGAIVCRLPDKNVLYIQTDDGSKIALSKKNVISIVDVTEQYSTGRKVMMVMWNDFETSILQLGKISTPPFAEAAAPDSGISKQTAPAKKKQTPGLLILLVLTGILLAAVLLMACIFLFGRDSHADMAETAAISTEALSIPETTVETEPPIEYADEAFLAAIEQSVAKRMELAEKNETGNAHFRELVNTELAIVEKYREALFFDQDLQKQMNKYLDGLYLQKDAIELSYSEHQIKWQEGLVLRYEALCALHDQYDAFADDSDFISSYVMELENARYRLQALKAIEADLLAQLDGVTLNYSSQNYGYAMYTNNTDYDFDVNFYFWFYDQNNVRFDENATGFTNLKSGETSKLTFYCPARASTFEFFWEIMPHS